MVKLTMDILQKNISRDLQFWLIKLQSNNSVVEKSGNLHQINIFKLRTFKNARSAHNFYLKKVKTICDEFSLIPWKGELVFGVRVNKNYEPQLDLVIYWQVIQEVILYRQLDSSTTEINDTEFMELVYWIKTTEVEFESTLKAVMNYILKHGTADVMIIN